MEALHAGIRRHYEVRIVRDEPPLVIRQGGENGDRLEGTEGKQGNEGNGNRFGDPVGEVTTEESIFVIFAPFCSISDPPAVKKNGQTADELSRP